MTNIKDISNQPLNPIPTQSPDPKKIVIKPGESKMFEADSFNMEIKDNGDFEVLPDPKAWEDITEPNKNEKLNLNKLKYMMEKTLTEEFYEILEIKDHDERWRRLYDWGEKKEEQE